jgi:hypothetical protein
VPATPKQQPQLTPLRNRPSGHISLEPTTPVNESTEYSPFHKVTSAEKYSAIDFGKTPLYTKLMQGENITAVP